ncbi:MAG: MBL fold metallo-hydrolase [Verrucomicrobiota bacterium]
MINRRSFFKQGGLAGLGLAAASLAVSRAVADPDPAPGSKPLSPGARTLPDPEIYPFQLGGREAFVVHDGSIQFPGIQPIFAPEAGTAELDALLQKQFLPADHLALSVNVLVVKSADGVQLFDGGAGGSMGPSAGRLVAGLARIGIAPGEVKTVFVTHAHPDHIAGLLQENHPVFPSARIVASKTEVDFWTGAAPDLSGTRLPPEMRAQAAASIKGLLNNLSPALDLKGPGKVASNVELIASPGHTPGHALFLVSEGDDKLMVIGDIVHAWALQFAHPEWTMAFDTDPKQAIATRRKFFQQLASDRMAVSAYHLPFPGLGHVRTAGKDFEWAARPWVV